MKKNKFTEFFKGKGYYVLLFVGVIAIAAVAFVGSSLSSSQKPNTDNSVDLNEPDNNNIAANDNNNQTANNQTSNEVANKDQTGNTTNDVAANDKEQKVASNDNAIELEGYDEGASGQSQETADNKTGTAQAKAEEPATVETSGKTVQADASSSLSFKADDGLLWPVTGDVIMNYSMDHTIYHATLMEYKCNPAIIIGADVGTNVKAAAKGIVEKIDRDRLYCYNEYR